MKKILCLIFMIFLLPCAVFASELSPKDLKFAPDTSGKYIYCNNVEFITRSELADTSNPTPKYIMNNELEAGKYAFFASHVNHTEIRDNSGVMTEAGFDIELDVEFIAKEDTVIKITSLGFEVPENKKYYYNGRAYTYEEAWGCLNAWASYKKIPIRQMESGKIYEPLEFSEKTVEIKKGETFYLSSVIPNYAVVPFYRPVHILADFEVVSGKTECNVCAFKSCGHLGDRSNKSGNIAFGSYERDRQYKGIADSLNSVSVDLNYAIDDWVGGDTFFPVRVYNPYVPMGNDVNVWATHINPNADIWAKYSSAASDMLAFKYKDNSKLMYYGSAVKDSLKEDTWYFDIHHSDTAIYPGKEIGISKTAYKPNAEIQPFSNENFNCNLGNYGVSLNYNYNIRNDGEVTRFAAYNLNTTSNNIVILRDEFGNVVNDYALCKGAGAEKSTDTLACIELPGMSETKFSIEVILPTNYVGGMANSLVLKDFPIVIPVYENAYQEVAWDYSWTGREFIEWRNGELYSSTDLENWKHIPLSEEVEQIFHDNWNEYRIMYADGGYVVKPCIYDSVPYYGAREYFRDVYFLDSDFTLKETVKFNRYPTDMSYAKGKYYVTAGSRFVSDDIKEWTLTSADTSMPVDNNNIFSAYSKDNTIYLSKDGEKYYPLVTDKNTPEFVECLGDVYYCIDKNILFLSGDGVYWDKFEFDERIDYVRRVEEKILVNNTHSFEYLPESSLVLMIDDKYISFDEDIIYDESGSAFVPAKQLLKAMGVSAYYGSEYVGLRETLENGGYKISYDSENDIVAATLK